MQHSISVMKCLNNDSKLLQMLRQLKKIVMKLFFINGLAFISLLSLMNQSNQLILDDDGGYRNITVIINPYVTANKIDIQLMIRNLHEILTELSKILYEATAGVFYIKHANVLFPPSWRTYVISQLRKTYAQDGFTYYEPDIRIDKANPLYHNKPYTLQPHGCGHLGKYIHLTPEYLIDDEAMETKSKNLVHQWAHLRYGVFDEFGYIGDHLYPRFYQHTKTNATPTGCSNVPINGEFIDESTNISCNSLSFRQLLKSSCTLKASKAENEGVKSSLMYLHNLPNVTAFCGGSQDEFPHIIDAPTKHNFLCNYTSVWHVIKKSKDFQSVTTTASLPEFEMNLIEQRNAPGIIILVDVSERRLKNQRVKLTQLAMWWTTESYVNLNYEIITYAKNVNAPTKDFKCLSLTEAANESCVTCAMEKMATSSDKTGIKNVVLVSNGLVNNGDFKLIKDVILQSQINLFVILYPFMGQARAWMNVAKKVFVIDEQSYFETLNRLQQAMLTILNTIKPENAPQTYVKNIINEGPHKSHPYSGQFEMASSSGKVLRAISTDSLDVNLTIGGQTYESASLYTTRYFDGIFQSIRCKADSGMWKYSTTNDNLYISAYFEGSQNVDISAWMNFNDKNEPPVIYTKLSMDYRPVLKVHITAVIERYGNNSSYTELSHITLQDNGNAEPDITANDGVYSGYCLEKMDNKSIYNIKIYLSQQPAVLFISRTWTDVNCCGSFIPISKTSSMNLTDVEVSVGTIILTESTDVEHFPPGRITDLKMDEVRLMWTSPGSRYNRGTASAYQIAVSENRSQIILDFNAWKNLVGLKPSTAGTMETWPVMGYMRDNFGTDGDDDTRIFYCAIRAQNDDNIHSNPSNIVDIFIAAETLLTTPSLETTEEPTKGTVTETKTTHGLKSSQSTERFEISSPITTNDPSSSEPEASTQPISLITTSYKPEITKKAATLFTDTHKNLLFVFGSILLLMIILGSVGLFFYKLKKSGRLGSSELQDEEDDLWQQASRFGRTSQDVNLETLSQKRVNEFIELDNTPKKKKIYGK